MSENRSFGLQAWTNQIMLCVAFWGPVTSDRAQIWHACADRYSHLKKKLTHPTRGGFRGLSIVKNLSRRTTPKFGTHVRIDTLTLKKLNFLTHPTPGVFRRLNCLARLALARERTPSIIKQEHILISRSTAKLSTIRRQPLRSWTTDRSMATTHQVGNIMIYDDIRKKKTSS